MSISAFLRTALPLLALLAACGGGGKGGSDAGPNPGGTPATAATLQGVVSVGALLGNANVAVIDATGKALGSTTTQASDGSYRLSLSEASPKLPLLAQARGLDAAGQWVVLHALVPALAASTTATTTADTTAHITPLTHAVAALALGGDPQTAFAKPASTQLATVTVALDMAASAFLKTLLKTPLADLKISSPEALNLLSDSGFARSKSSADLLLEALRVRVEGDGAWLTLGSKFLASPAAEVVVNLPSARAELIRTAGVPANAITSPLKVTSAAATVLTNAALLDGIVTTLNPLLAQAASAAVLQASAPMATYTKHDGRTATELAALMADWGTRNLQLGPLQVLGCADDVPKTGDCLRVLVASPLTDRSGRVVERLLDAAGYDSRTKRWTLTGNGKSLGFEVRPASWLRLDGVGVALTGTAANGGNPVAGIELLQQGRDAANTTDLVTSATVLTPLGYALPLAACTRPQLCLASAGATTVAPLGGLADHLLQPGTLGWLGGADTLRGAQYLANYTRAGVAEQRRAWLHTGMVAVVASRHPLVDGVAASTPLTVGQVVGGFTVKWGTWAAANPDLRLRRVRSVIRYASHVVLTEIDTGNATEGTLPALTPTSGDTALDHQLWLFAVDAQGQQIVSNYALGP